MRIDTWVKVSRCGSIPAGTLQRQGSGRLMHADTSEPWLQDKLIMEEFVVENIPRQNNVADLMTRTLTWTEIPKHLEIADGFSVWCVKVASRVV